MKVYSISSYEFVLKDYLQNCRLILSSRPFKEKPCRVIWAPSQQLAHVVDLKRFVLLGATELPSPLIDRPREASAESFPDCRDPERQVEQAG